MRYLADTNVVLALLVEGHAGRPAALEWFANCDDSDLLLTWPVRLSVMRLLMSPTVMGPDAVDATAAWTALRTLELDYRVASLREPENPLLHFRIRLDKAGREMNLLPDVWLAAAAASHLVGVVTFDRDFLKLNVPDLVVLKNKA